MRDLERLAAEDKLSVLGSFTTDDELMSCHSESAEHGIYIFV